MLRFTWLYATAWIRGLLYPWPPSVPTRGYYRMAWVSLVSWSECFSLYQTDYHWEPWALRRVRGYGCDGWSGLFRIPTTEEEKQYEAIADAQAEAYYKDMANKQATEASELQARED